MGHRRWIGLAGAAAMLLPGAAAAEWALQEQGGGMAARSVSADGAVSIQVACNGWMTPQFQFTGYGGAGLDTTDDSTSQVEVTIYDASGAALHGGAFPFYYFAPDATWLSAQGRVPDFLDAWARGAEMRLSTPTGTPIGRFALDGAAEARAAMTRNCNQPPVAGASPATPAPAQVTVGPVDAGFYSREARREAQTALNHFGFDAGTPDGIFGPRTFRAIAAWRASRGMSYTPVFSRVEMSLLIEDYRRAIGFTGVERDPSSQMTLAPGAALPAAVARLLEETARDCGTSAEALRGKPGLMQTADMNGDGQIDFVIDGSAAACAYLCGAAQCQVTVLASSPGGYVRNDFLGTGVGTATFACGADGQCAFARPQ